MLDLIFAPRPYPDPGWLGRVNGWKVSRANSGSPWHYCCDPSRGSERPGLGSPLGGNRQIHETSSRQNQQAGHGGEEGEQGRLPVFNPTQWLRKTGVGTGLRGKIRSSVLDSLIVRHLQNPPVRTSTRQSQHPNQRGDPDQRWDVPATPMERMTRKEGPGREPEELWVKKW